MAMQELGGQKLSEILSEQNHETLVTLSRDHCHQIIEFNIF